MQFFTDTLVLQKLGVRQLLGSAPSWAITVRDRVAVAVPGVSLGAQARALSNIYFCDVNVAKELGLSSMPGVPCNAADCSLLCFVFTRCCIRADCERRRFLGDHTWQPGNRCFVPAFDCAALASAPRQEVCSFDVVALLRVQCCVFGFDLLTRYQTDGMTSSASLLNAYLTRTSTSRRRRCLVSLCVVINVIVFELRVRRRTLQGTAPSHNELNLISSIC